MKKVVFDDTVVDGDTIRLTSQDGESTVIIEVSKARRKAAGPALQLVVKNG